MADNDVIKIASGHQEIGPLLTADELAAIQAASSPSASNPFATGNEGLLIATKTLTSADLLTAFFSISILDGVADEVHVPIAVVLAYHAGATPYTDNGADLSVTANGNNVYGTAVVAGSALAQSLDGLAGLGGLSFAFDLVNLAGVDINLATSASLTDGDGTLDVTVYYRKLAVVRSESLAFVAQPSAELTNAVITPSPTVRVLDQDGNLYTKGPVEVTVELTVPGAATLGGTTTQTSVAGVATFNDLTVDVADTYTLTATGVSGYDGATPLTPAVSSAFVISAP